MKKFILTVIFFIVGIFKPRKRVLTKPKGYYSKKKKQKDTRRKPKKIKKYKNSK